MAGLETQVYRITPTKTSESTGKAAALKDGDLDAAVGGLCATGTGNVEKFKAWRLQAGE